MQASRALPTSIKEQETHWLRKALNSLHHKATKQKVLMGIWRHASGNKFVGIHNRLGMQFVSKFKGTLVVKSQLFKLVTTRGVFFVSILSWIEEVWTI
eukprot:316963-Pelagomonas_calceolata.AAC.1